jgi:hypothetical protein
MRHLISGAFLALAVVTAGPAWAGRCGETPGDIDALNAVRASIESQDCPCASFASHSAYVGCVRNAAFQYVLSGELPAVCRKEALRCASKSACGRPQYAPCCIFTSLGRRKCKTMLPARCILKAQPSKPTCVGQLPSCCDACGTAGMCVTTTTSTTTSTIP